MKQFIISILILISTSGFAQAVGKIQGVVTYTTINSSSSRPDVGTKIMFKKISQNDTVNNILHKQGYYNVTYNSGREIYKVIKPTATQLNKQNIKKDSLDFYTAKSKEYIKNISKNDELPVLSVDGSGNYSFEIKPGFYEVIADSEASTNSIKYEIIEIKPNQTRVVNFDFLVY